MSYWHGWRHKFTVQTDRAALTAALHRLGARVHDVGERVDAYLELYPIQDYPRIGFMACIDRTDSTLWLVSIRIDGTPVLSGSLATIERFRQKYPDPERFCDRPIQEFEDRLRGALKELES